MFARWDTQGLGTVTATQFLRVLARLHVELSDQEQDFIVELLDTNAMGRIDFESLLNFCFGNVENVSSMEPGLMSPISLKTGFKSLSGEDFTGYDTLSAVSAVPPLMLICFLFSFAALLSILNALENLISAVVT
jgi:hypothetical protein